MKLKIKKGATVEVVTGEDKGKRGAVLDINTRLMRVKVQGVRIQKRHSKKDGIVSNEGFIDYSNVKLVSSAAKKTKKKASKKSASK